MPFEVGDIVFLNATVIDGSGLERFKTDVLVRAGHIQCLSLNLLDDLPNGEDNDIVRFIDCEDGKWVLSPGFIDMHAHSDLSLLHTPNHAAKLTQGCTTEVIGQDGVSYSPVSDLTLARIRTQIAGWNSNPLDPPDFFDRWRTVKEYLDVLDREGIATNVAYLVPQGNLRMLVKGWDSSPCSQEDIHTMKKILKTSLQEGAVGMSSGLTYVPGMFADNDELAQLCEVVREHGGYYCPHHRSYGKGAMNAYREMIVLAKKTGVRLHLTHATLNYAENAGRADELIAMIDEGLADGVDISLDTYPYLPGSTTLASTLPSWAASADDKVAVLNDPKQLEKIRHQALVDGTDGCHGCTLGWDILEIGGVSDPSLASKYVGKTIAQIAQEQGRDPFDVYIDILKEDDFNSTILSHSGHEGNVRKIMRHPRHTGGSDGILTSTKPHPRGWGTFARYLGHYCRDLARGSVRDIYHPAKSDVFEDTEAETIFEGGVEEAVAHLTGRAASVIGLKDRGLVKEGYRADLVLFDPETIRDVATFSNPKQPANGIRAVLVNGMFAVDEGKPTGVRAGRTIRARLENAVSISHQTEIISPLILGNQKNVDDLDLDSGRRSRKNSLIKKASSKRLSGRPPSFTSPVLRPRYAGSTQTDTGDDSGCPSSASSQHRHSGHHLEQLVDQVSQWIKEERLKHAERKAKRGKEKAGLDAEVDGADEQEFFFSEGAPSSSRDLDKLEAIIKQNLSVERRSRSSRNRSPNLSRKGSLLRLNRKQSTASSDTEHIDDESLVPACDAALDNSKTLSYTGGASEDSDSDSDELQRSSSYRDGDEWSRFKFEIVRITHTLRLKRWRRVALDMSGGITVQRLSGALTNAVYVVSPPSNLDLKQRSGNAESTPYKPPPKLLLRIYGPQVEHLIDREAELAILRRLARKKIGPRLLGTFANGRFEEYFYAKTLTPDDLRNPDTSRQIAKRMRELHDGIELLDQERDDGPFVWRNWDKWVARVEQVVCWLDCQIHRLPAGAKPTGSEAWKRRGFICGVPWKQFRGMVEKYRKYLYAQYGSTRQVKEQLVFAHNDTQYGNILRLMPTGESPLLLPQNTHKQLVVIDFEYSNANVVGLEFANHFTEWSYDYHDERKPYAFHPSRYPTPEEQERFVRAYVRHRPEVNVSTPRMAPSTPTMSANDSSESLARRPTSSIADFILDARTPSVGTLSYASEEANRKTVEDQEVARLLHETRLWRLANTAQWVAWGIVQAKVPGMPDFSSSAGSGPGAPSEEESRDDLGEETDVYKEMVAQQQNENTNGTDVVMEEEFDYLGYSQHRALFFWADCLQLGLTRAEDLPEELRLKLKSVPY